MFHVSQLKKCLRVPKEQIPMEQLDLGGDLSYSERPIRILDIAEWPTEDEATWENEEELRANYLELFLSVSESQGWDSFEGGGG
jgi:hypothetical protein